MAKRKIKLAPCPRCGGSDVHIVDEWHCCGLSLGPALPFGEPENWPRAQLWHYVQCRACLCRSRVLPRDWAAHVWRKRKWLEVPRRPKLYAVNGVLVEGAQ